MKCFVSGWTKHSAWSKVEFWGFYCFTKKIQFHFLSTQNIFYNYRLAVLNSKASYSYCSLGKSLGNYFFPGGGVNFHRTLHVEGGEGDEGVGLKMKTSNWWRCKERFKYGIMADQVLKPPQIVIVLHQDSSYGAGLLLHSPAVGQLSTPALLRLRVP